ncbi:hypothetical protein B0H13DRAFT_2326015 [Mycena leptocephala]|nr:hypothetical protein B0H13DRAFT_2326015 [Mycena leptocephala]
MTELGSLWPSFDCQLARLALTSIINLTILTLSLAQMSSRKQQHGPSLKPVDDGTGPRDDGTGSREWDSGIINFNVRPPAPRSGPPRRAEAPRSGPSGERQGGSAGSPPR